MEINDIIKKSSGDEITEMLSDKALKQKFLENKIISNKIDGLGLILKKNKVPMDTIAKILDDYMSELIPSAVRNKIKRDIFSNYVNDIITNSYEENNNEIKISFNSIPAGCILPINENPNWLLTNSEKTICGFNLLNVTAKNSFISEDLVHKNPNIRIITLVPTLKEIKNSKSLVNKVIAYGLATKRLYTVKNLTETIDEFFELD